MISFFRNSDKVFFVVEHKSEFSESEVDKLEWLFSGSKLLKEKKLEGKFIGPRIEMTTPWSTNAVEITKNVGINNGVVSYSVSLNFLDIIIRDSIEFDESCIISFI